VRRRGGGGGGGGGGGECECECGLEGASEVSAGPPFKLDVLLLVSSRPSIILSSLLYLSVSV
jgi:hypothetical protein